MELVDLATHLAQQGIGEVTGPTKNIFIYHMPESVTKGVLLLDPELGSTIDHELPKYFKTGFICVVRHTDYVAGRQWADQVSSELTIYNSVVGSMKVNYIRPTNQPTVFPASEAGLLEWSIYFDACYTLSS